MVWWQMNLVLTIQIHPKPTHPSFQTALPFPQTKTPLTACGGALVNFLLSPQPNPISSLQFNLQTSHWKFHKFPTTFLTPKTTLYTNVSKNFNWFPGFNWFQLVFYRFAGGQKVFFRRTCTCLNFCVWPSNGQSLKVLRINWKIEKMKSGRLTDFEIRVKCVRAYQTKSFRTVAAALAVLP